MKPIFSYPHIHRVYPQIYSLHKNFPGFIMVLPLKNKVIKPLCLQNLTIHLTRKEACFIMVADIMEILFLSREPCTRPTSVSR